MKTNRMPQAIVMISLLGPWMSVFSQTPTPEKTNVEQKLVIQKNSLTAMLGESVTFSTLTKALKAAGLDGIMGDKGEFTLFAPTDEAFAKIPSDVLARLLMPENKEKLRSLLLYHVVAGKVLAADLKDGEVKTMSGEKVKVAVGSKNVVINESKVFSTDVMASNGVMHSIGTVMIPRSLNGFAGLDK
jgi:uncharacterized surface protein with fasciclin (FAS1) repeats